MGSSSVAAPRVPFVPFGDLYPPDLEDVGDEIDLADGDRYVYRLVKRRLSIVGMPDAIDVGAVRVSFTTGPVRTQVTEVRRRPGLPFVFDKRTRHGVSVGRGTCSRRANSSRTGPMTSWRR